MHADSAAERSELQCVLGTASLLRDGFGSTDRRTERERHVTRVPRSRIAIVSIRFREYFGVGGHVRRVGSDRYPARLPPK